MSEMLPPTPGAAEAVLPMTGAPPVAIGTGPLGKPEKIGKQVLLSAVTLSLYSLYWVYKSHTEINNHTGTGMSGAVGLLVFLVFSPITFFLLPIEIKKMYEADGRESPVGPGTAAWVLLFAVPWYVKCQQALNDYWIAKGAPAAQ